MTALLKIKSVYGDTFFIKPCDYELVKKSEKRKQIALFKKDGTRKRSRMVGTGSGYIDSSIHIDNIASVES